MALEIEAVMPVEEDAGLMTGLRSGVCLEPTDMARVLWAS